MEIDYSAFLHVLQDGSIWWRLTDAVKLGAGYLPICDDDRDLTPVLRAKNNRIRADERTLLSEFSQDHYTDAHPRLLTREDGRYVEAHEFLDWLSKHLVAQTQSTILFPNDLASAVKKATGAPNARSTAPPRFESLTIALEEWFDSPLCDLPETMRQRVEQEFFPMPWDGVSADGRRSVALQLDYQHDPATEQDQKYWWDFFEQVDSLKKQVAEWEVVATPTAAELALRETRLAELKQELARMDTQKRLARGDYYPERKRPDGEGEAVAPSPSSSVQYVAYPKAMHQLEERFGATPDELAAWVWMGPKSGGLVAYLNANELDPPPQFYYIPGTDSQNYVAPLMACWFRADEIDLFAPAERYITGAALIERWGKRPGMHPVPYIRAKIAESRLNDLHPIYGGTQGTFSEHADFPPLASGLFPLSQIEDIEAEDFATVVEPNTAVQRQIPPLAHVPRASDLGSPEWRRQNARDAANARHDQPGGSRDKQRQIREIWASGKYSSKDICAEQECSALAMSFSAARRALNNEPEPNRC